MISPVHHPVTPNQTESVPSQAQPKQTAQKAVPKQEQDSVTLSKTGGADRKGDSK